MKFDLISILGLELTIENIVRVNDIWRDLKQKEVEGER